jgi:hypothetical protein
MLYEDLSMLEEKKEKIATLAARFPIDTFVSYVEKADPNEGMPRDLLEILFAKLTDDSITIDESNKLNSAFATMINNGLDLTRKVDWLQLTGKISPNVFLAAAATEKVDQVNIFRLMEKSAPINDEGTGRNILRSAIYNVRYDAFNELFDGGVRATDIADVNHMMLDLAISSSDDPEPSDIEKTYNLAMKILSMGPDLFEIKLQGQTVSDVFAEKGHIKLSGLISSLKLRTTIESQVQEKTGTEDEAEFLESTFAGRGINVFS